MGGLHSPAASSRHVDTNKGLVMCPDIGWIRGDVLEGCPVDVDDGLPDLESPGQSRGLES